MTATTSWITHKPGRCGGAACIRDTRITVWGQVEYRRLGMSDEVILQAFQGFTAADLQAAWDFTADHPDEIERSLWQNEAGMIEHSGDIPVEMVRRGHQLGLADEVIRNACEPPLSQEALDAALTATREA